MNIFLEGNTTVSLHNSYKDEKQVPHIMLINNNFYLENLCSLFFQDAFARDMFLSKSGQFQVSPELL